MARKDKKLTEAVKKQLVELMSTGLTVTKALKAMGNPCTKAAVDKEKQRNDKFNALMDDAYYNMMQAWADRLEELATTPASVAYPNLEFREAEATLKRECDALKFLIAKVAPVNTKRAEKSQKIEHTGTVHTGITVMLDDYRIPAVIEHKP